MATDKEVGKLSRRRLFGVGAAIAGASALPPTITHLATADVSLKDLFGAKASGVSAPLPGDWESGPRDIPKSFPASLRPSRTNRPNVVLIVMDTVRADHLSCYGYRRETTPKIDAFAAGARLYKNVLSPSSFTLPSHASLFTGLSATAHGTHWMHRFLDEQFETLAEKLTANGYQTVGLSSNGYLVSHDTGLDRGFQKFWSTLPRTVNGLTAAAAMHNQLISWFNDCYEPEKPFFLFMNYIEAHEPYIAPLSAEPFTPLETWQRWQSRESIGELLFEHMLTGSDMLSSKEIEELESLYDDGIKYVDHMVGQVLAFFKSTGLEKDTLVIITSDHGEHFDEHHMMDHQYSVYEPLVRVPLIVRLPGRFAAGEESSLVQAHDVFPTILKLAGVEWKPSPGQNCRSLAQPAAKGRCCFTEYLAAEAGELDKLSLAYPKLDFSRFARELRAIQQENMKLICAADDEFELYDLAEDPMETRNLVDKKPDLTRELARKLNTWLASFEPYVSKAGAQDATKRVFSPAEMDAIRGLNYAR